MHKCSVLIIHVPHKVIIEGCCCYVSWCCCHHVTQLCWRQQYIWWLDIDSWGPRHIRDTNLDINSWGPGHIRDAYHIKKLWRSLAVLQSKLNVIGYQLVHVYLFLPLMDPVLFHARCPAVTCWFIMRARQNGRVEDPTKRGCNKFCIGHHPAAKLLAVPERQVVGGN